MGKKRHHYVPAFYLNGFATSSNNIAVYEKGNNEFKVISTRDTAVIKNYYSFPAGEGIDSDTIENFFAELENKAAPVLRKIHQRDTLSDEDRAWFANFIAASMLRVPNYRQMIEDTHAENVKRITMMMASDKEAWEKSYEKFEEATGTKIDIPIEELRQFAMDGSRYDVKSSPEYSLRIIQHIPKIGNLFYKMNWTYLESHPDCKFITSDNPVHYDDPTRDPSQFWGVGLINRNIEVIFPLSKEIGLLATWVKLESTYQKVSKTIVKTANRRTIISAEKYVFAHFKSESLNKCAQKYRGSAPRIRVG